tara:strand:- start:386 stop:1699 length:1314 start_codon:yes stop_codon:yes gene_type:complete
MAPLPLGILALAGAGGAPAWAMTQGTNSYSNNAQGITTDADGNVFSVAKFTQGADGMMLSKFDSAGVEQWRRDLRLATGTTTINYNWNNCVATDSTGAAYVVAKRYDSSNGNRTIVWKISTSGSSVWTRELAKTNYTNDLTQIRIDANDNIYLSGVSPGLGAAETAVLFKMNTSGATVWQRYYSTGYGSNNTEAYGVDVDSSGNIYTAGETFDDQIGNRFMAAKYNSSGTLQWKKTISDSNTIASGYGVSVDSNDNIYMSGFLIPSSLVGYLVKLDSSGAIVWQRENGDGRTYQVETDSSGNVYTVTDTSQYVYYYDSSGTNTVRNSVGTSKVNFTTPHIHISSNDKYYFQGGARLNSAPETYVLNMELYADGSGTGTIALQNDTFSYSSDSVSTIAASASITDRTGNGDNGTSDLTNVSTSASVTTPNLTQYITTY